jgi:hypothetical protein
VQLVGHADRVSKHEQSIRVAWGRSDQGSCGISRADACRTGRRLTPSEKKSVIAMLPKYAAVNGSLGPEIRCWTA